MADAEDDDVFDDGGDVFEDDLGIRPLSGAITADQNPLLDEAWTSSGQRKKMHTMANHMAKDANMFLEKGALYNPHAAVE
eukprot:SAG31_NODE_37176_length_306_cov_1.212560_1_plen_79_part_01